MPCKSQEAWGPQNADEELRGAWRRLTTQTGVALLHTAASDNTDWGSLAAYCSASPRRQAIRRFPCSSVGHWYWLLRSRNCMWNPFQSPFPSYSGRRIWASLGQRPQGNDCVMDRLESIPNSILRGPQGSGPASKVDQPARVTPTVEDPVDGTAWGNPRGSDSPTDVTA